MNNLKYYIAAICAFSIWGTFSLVLKPLHEYQSIDILFYRVFSCALIMSVISILFKRKQIKNTIDHFMSLSKKKKWTIACVNIGSSILLTANWFSFIYVMNHVSVRATSVAYLVCPIITTILAYLILRDQLTKFQWISVLVSLVGCILLSYTNVIDMFYSSVIGMTYAAYLVCQKLNTGLDKFLTLNFHILLSAIILLPFYPEFSGNLPTDFDFYIYVEIIAIVYTIIPLFLNLFSLSGINSSKVGMMLNINPIIAFILAGVVYHEPVEPLQIFAYVLIFLSVLVFNGNQIFHFKSR